MLKRLTERLGSDGDAGDTFHLAAVARRDGWEAEKVQDSLGGEGYLVISQRDCGAVGSGISTVQRRRQFGPQYAQWNAERDPFLSVDR